MLRAFRGQTVDGALFGSTGQLVLPTFTQIEPVSAQDNSWKVDSLAETEENEAERWAVKAKWCYQRADYLDIVCFLSLTLDFHARGWFIAKTVLTTAAAEYARDKGSAGEHRTRSASVGGAPRRAIRQVGAGKSCVVRTHCGPCDLCVRHDLSAFDAFDLL